MIGTMMLGDDRGNCRVVFSQIVGTGFCFAVAGLKNGVRFVIAALGINRPDDGDFIHHCSLFRNMFAKAHAWNRSGDGCERPAIL